MITFNKEQVSFLQQLCLEKDREIMALKKIRDYQGDQLESLKVEKNSLHDTITTLIPKLNESTVRITQYEDKQQELLTEINTITALLKDQETIQCKWEELTQRCNQLTQDLHSMGNAFRTKQTECKALEQQRNRAERQVSSTLRGLRLVKTELARVQKLYIDECEFAQEKKNIIKNQHEKLAKLEEMLKIALEEHERDLKAIEDLRITAEYDRILKAPLDTSEHKAFFRKLAKTRRKKIRNAYSRIRFLNAEHQKSTQTIDVLIQQRDKAQERINNLLQNIDNLTVKLSSPQIKDPNAEIVALKQGDLCCHTCRHCQDSDGELFCTYEEDVTSIARIVKEGKGFDCYSPIELTAMEQAFEDLEPKYEPLPDDPDDADTCAWLPKVNVCRYCVHLQNCLIENKEDRVFCLNAELCPSLASGQVLPIQFAPQVHEIIVITVYGSVCRAKYRKDAVAYEVLGGDAKGQLYFDCLVGWLTIGKLKCFNFQDCYDDYTIDPDIDHLKRIRTPFTYLTKTLKFVDLRFDENDDYYHDTDTPSDVYDTCDLYGVLTRP